ncbi:MAG TPA: alkaline phosphatase family protein [Solirubrobacteraceae bacterium]|nr:alkaline phosphatase family protein [Solirubrobacteraceae bacterium]
MFVIVLENESAAVTFGPDSPAPYLSRTLPARGAFVPDCYGVGHASLDNYIAMISGQAPTPSTQADCGVFADFTAGGPLGSFGQQPGSGCVEDGLLMVIFDEAAGGDSSSCCGEIPGPAAPEPGGTGTGGGRTGAVILSPCTAPGTITHTAYDHYTMLGSVENIFGLSHLGYAGLPHSVSFGTDIYKRQCGPSPPTVTGSAAFVLGGRRTQAVLRWTVSTTGGTPLASSQLQKRVRGGWRTVLGRAKRTSYSFVTRVNHTYDFRVRAVNAAGQASRWLSGLVVGSVT